jgi:hypothetical protein
MTKSTKSTIYSENNLFIKGLELVSLDGEPVHLILGTQSEGELS